MKVERRKVCQMDKLTIPNIVFFGYRRVYAIIAYNSFADENQLGELLSFY